MKTLSTQWRTGKLCLLLCRPLVCVVNDDEENETRPSHLIDTEMFKVQPAVDCSSPLPRAFIMPVNVPDHCGSVTGSQLSGRVRLCYEGYEQREIMFESMVGFSAMPDSKEVALYRCGMPRKT